MVQGVKKMDQIKKFLPQNFIGLIIVAGLCVAGCTGPQQIVAPDVRELSMSKVGQIERDGLTMRATILDEKQAERLLNVDITRRNVIPVLFVMSNETENSYSVRREHFALRIGKFCIEPTLPGRAATLLRNSSRSQGAAWAGYLVFGIFAAPSIDAAEKKEAASVEGHREVIFSQAYLTPSSSIAGYLFFEPPTSLKNVRWLNLGLHISGNTEDLVLIQLTNPYSTLLGE